MPWYKNFESEEHRHARENIDERTNYSAWNNPTVTAKTNEQKGFFQQHIKQYTEFISWAR